VNERCEGRRWNALAVPERDRAPSGVRAEIAVELRAQTLSRA